MSLLSAPRRFLAPSFLGLTLAAFSLLLAAPNVQAGTFVWQTKDAQGNVTARSPVYSGGTVGGGPTGPNSSVSPAPFTSNGAYVGTAGYAGYSSGGCDADAHGHATSVTVTASGPLTAKFTWQPAYPGEPAPASVIFSQDCRAALTNNRSSPICNSSSICTDGLGGSAALPFSGTQTATESYKYSVGVVGSDGTVSVSCSPSAVYSMSCYPGVGSYASGSASISYTVVIYPVTVNIIGTYNSAAGNYRALTGQQITASLGSSYGLPSGVKVTGYTWSFSNSNPIKSWDPNAPGDGQPTQIIPLVPTDYINFAPIGSSVTLNPISFYDEIADDTVTVKCAVTLKLPDFSTPTINVESPKITFVKPTAKWDVVTGFMQGVFSKTINLGGLALVPVPGSQQQGGEAWNNVTVNVPSPFYGGQGCFAQLVTPDIAVINDDSTKSVVDAKNKQQGLDNSFPYASYTWSVPAVGASADNPGVFFSNYNTPAYQGFNTVTFSDKFGTWVMYKPPAVGSQGTIWVPLQSYSWSCSSTVQWINNQWTVTAASPASAADDPHYQPTGVMNIPPQWGVVQTNSK